MSAIAQVSGAAAPVASAARPARSNARSSSAVAARTAVPSFSGLRRDSLQTVPIYQVG